MTTEGLTFEELGMAARNHGMPLEALRYDVTPPGLHYLLIHYDVPEVDPGSWALEVDGAVGRVLRLDLASLREMPAVTMPVTFECAGNGRARLMPRPVSQPWLLEAVGNALWTGVALHHVLDVAGAAEDAAEILFTGLDRGVEGGEEQSYQRSLPMAEARRKEVILAYAMNDRPLPPQHGFPLRLVVPGWYGMASVKWLERITILATPFTGYQQTQSYRMRRDEADPGVPVTRILPRSLMVPPGIPEFMSRLRLVKPGPVLLIGRAWSGHGRVIRVEVSTDGGGTWMEAELEEPGGPHTWLRWTFRWQAEPGEAVLCSRATDETGMTQPDEPVWNVGGYQVNAIQRVQALVG